jgi:hypothetical protein
MNGFVANGRAYVKRSVNRYMPAHREPDGNVYVVLNGRWSTVGVVEDTFIGDYEADLNPALDTDPDR